MFVSVFTVLFFPNLPLLPASVGSERRSWEPGMGLHSESSWQDAWWKGQNTLCPKGFTSLAPFLKVYSLKASDDKSTNNMVEIVSLFIGIHTIYLFLSLLILMAFSLHRGSSFWVNVKLCLVKEPVESIKIMADPKILDQVLAAHDQHLWGFWQEWVINRRHPPVYTEQCGPWPWFLLCLPLGIEI